MLFRYCVRRSCPGRGALSFACPFRPSSRASPNARLQIGAVLTETVASRGDGKRRVLSTGRNGVERRHDASAHAEMLCLQVCLCF